MAVNHSRSGGEGERRSVEVEARTVDEAIARGLVRLGGLSRSEVDIEVLSGGRPGLLGFGGAPVRVRLTEKVGPSGAEGASRPSTLERPAARPAESRRARPSRAPAPVPEARREVDISDESVAELTAEERPAVEAAAQEVVGEMLQLLGYEEPSFELRDSLLPPGLEDRSSIVLSIRGPGTERLLAENARALNALQFLARLVLLRRLGRWANLLLDVGDDRARRMRELCQLAEQSAALVEREGRPVSLPPMTPYERRVVHLALRDRSDVTTQSIGHGENRKVTVRRRDQLLPEN